MLYGEINTGKTTITSAFLKFLLEREGIPPTDVNVMDFAPNLTTSGSVSFGGRILDFYPASKKCHYPLAEHGFIPVRFNSNNKKELFHSANQNRQFASQILNRCLNNPKSILIINDASIYLHRGDKKVLLKLIKASDTCFSNTYYGSSIGKGFSQAFSKLEKKRIEYLLRKLKDDESSILLNAEDARESV